jgi:hypothetical protein
MTRYDKKNAERKVQNKICKYPQTIIKNTQFMKIEVLIDIWHWKTHFK